MAKPSKPKKAWDHRTSSSTPLDLNRLPFSAGKVSEDQGT
jgi:hypothetical protein